MEAIEKAKEIRELCNRWQGAFTEDSTVIGKLSHRKVHWHELLGIWGMFGKTIGKGGKSRDWNAFGQKPRGFRSNIVVEINMPPCGIDQNLQAVFAKDSHGEIWLLHQGRMSVAGSRVTEADFMSATNLKPVTVHFSDSSSAEYHKVTNLFSTNIQIQKDMAVFIAHCAHARMVKTGGRAIPDMSDVKNWELGLSPEGVGCFEIASREAVIGRRHHGEIWRALAAELKKRNVPHSNDRVSQYGPDLYTYGNGPMVLFEIKSRCGAHDIFEGVGQLQIYDQLLNRSYRKVLVIPEGISASLLSPLGKISIETVEFKKQGKRVSFNKSALEKCLR